MSQIMTKTLHYIFVNNEISIALLSFLGFNAFQYLCSKGNSKASFEQTEHHTHPFLWLLTAHYWQN